MLVEPDRGFGANVFAKRLDCANAEGALEALNAGKADAIVLHAAAWQRLCTPDDPKVKPPCDDLRILLKARPQAALAIVVRKDISDETRYRLIGIHMPMHLENRAAFAWARAPRRLTPSSSSGNATFSAALSVAIRFRCWSTKPRWRRRRAACLVAD